MKKNALCTLGTMEVSVCTGHVYIWKVPEWGGGLVSMWNQSTIISLDWLNTFRIYFRTNRSLVHWCVRRQV